MSTESKQYIFNKTEYTSSLDPLKSEWQKSLTAPQDDMWEAFTDFADHWEIKEEDQLIGYACTNDDNGLLQFYLLPNWLQAGASIFQQFIDQENIKKAMIGTNNPVCLSLALHFQKLLKVDTYLFTDVLKVEFIEMHKPLRVVRSADLAIMVDYYHNSMGGPKDWLKGYLTNLIEREELFVLENKEDILGSCEVRKSDSDTKTANVGMAVAPAHRRKGLGSFLLGKAKEKAIEWGKKPICSCEMDNAGSLKSIQKNGFRSIHQMLYMEF